MELWLGAFQYGLPALGGVLVAWVTIVPQLRKTKRGLDTVQYAINNNHQTHLRDDLDSKFAKVEAKLDTIMERQLQTDRHVNVLDNRMERHLEDSLLVRRDINKKFNRLIGAIEE